MSERKLLSSAGCCHLHTTFMKLSNPGRTVLKAPVCRPGGLDESLRVTSQVFTYTLPLLFRGLYFHYLATISMWLGACLFFALANYFRLGGGWSHGIFHLLCFPFLHFMMSGVASA
ncbi:eef-2 [Symbiodinium microadriaticum]|nr:eef-2 [Symbiodinium microadriaticum]